MLSFSQHRFYYLLVVLLLMILIDPLVEDYAILAIALDVFTSLLFILGCFAVSNKKIVPWLAIALSIPMLFSIWKRYLGFDIPQLLVAGKISGVIYFALVSGVILAHVFRAKNVTWQVISAALIVYLSLGVMWGFAYSMIELLQPASFQVPSGQTDVGSGFMYYSFITLTTVGFGDIHPVTGVARAFSMLEGIIGQFYMTVLIARLVGMHAASAKGK